MADARSAQSASAYRLALSTTLTKMLEHQICKLISENGYKELHRALS